MKDYVSDYSSFVIDCMMIIGISGEITCHSLHTLMGRHLITCVTSSAYRLRAHQYTSGLPRLHKHSGIQTSSAHRLRAHQYTSGLPRLHKHSGSYTNIQRSALARLPIHLRLASLAYSHNLHTHCISVFNYA